MTLIDPDTERWLCCGQSVHAAGCTTNTDSYRYGCETTWSVLGLVPRQPSCRDCGVRLGQHHHVRCCLAICRRCNQQQLMCACATPTLEFVQ
jgi:hypothetical protein